MKGLIKEFIKSDIGLELSDEKTKITHINEGFDFLSYNFRKYNGKMLIKPPKASVLKHSHKLKQTMKQYNGSNLRTMLRPLNSQIRGSVVHNFTELASILLLRGVWWDRTSNTTQLRRDPVSPCLPLSVSPSLRAIGKPGDSG